MIEEIIQAFEAEIITLDEAKALALIYFSQQGLCLSKEEKK